MSVTRKKGWSTANRHENGIPLPFFFVLSSCFILLISCHSFIDAPQFRSLNSGQTGITFSNILQENDTFNIIQYLYFYNGGGVAVGDVNNDGLPDIYFSANQLSNRLFLNRGVNDAGQIRFEDVTRQAGVAGTGNWTTGVSMVDINGDGWLDIYVCQVGGYQQFDGKNQFFINNGCLDSSHGCTVTFTDRAAEYGLDHSGFSTQAAFLDYDLDGDPDMYLLCHSVHSPDTYRDTSATRVRDFRAGDKLFRNNLNGAGNQVLPFEDVSESAGIIGGLAGYGLGVTIGDVDHNGYPDIYVGNDFHENDFLYLNRTDGTFSEGSRRLLGHTSYFSMGNDLADINNDGWLDIITLDMKPDDEVIFKNSQGPDSYDIYRFKRDFGYQDQFPRNMLQLNNGFNDSDEIRFTEVGQMMGIAATDWSWSALAADFNLDGWKDLYITNGIVRRPNNLDYLKYLANKKVQEQASDLEIASQMPSGTSSNVLYLNQSGQTFEEVTKAWGLSRPSISNGAVYADFDLDGDPDIVVNNINEPAFYFENLITEQTSGSYLNIRFQGPPFNRFGLATKVWVYSGKMVQFQELYPSRGWQSSQDYCLYFGLGDRNLADSVIIQWSDGNRQTMTAVNSGQLITADYRDSRPELPLKKIASPSQTSREVSAELGIHFRHRENIFYDNNREPLIPYLLSTQGPKIAVADVNGDAVDDFFIGGATGQSGQLFCQLADRFYGSPQSVFLHDSLSEDTDAVFFDADDDGDPDLYVGSGGNQFYRQDPALIDRLYRNDGQGNFTRSTGALPVFYNQTSCVRPADFDGDGDLDLFVGSRSVPVNYGKAADSYLLINDGTGQFSQADERIIDLSALGMVTDAVWTDVDGDLDPDLIVVGDWMPVTILLNHNGQFEKSIISDQGPHRLGNSGWWNTIEAADLDQDGDMDLVMGNFGTNSNLQPSVKEPVRLYLSDFDANLTPDPILAYYRQGMEYPLAGLDALAGQLVFLKKRYRTYASFAGQTIREIFTREQLGRADTRSATNFHSVVALNNGSGQFNFEVLPWQAQVAPVFAIEIFDFNGDQHPDILAAGNFYEVQPAIGRMDAGLGTLLTGNGTGQFSHNRQDMTGLFLEGQVRDLAIIRTLSGTVLLVARNNADLQCFNLKIVQ